MWARGTVISTGPKQHRSWPRVQFDSDGTIYQVKMTPGNYAGHDLDHGCWRFIDLDDNTAAAASSPAMHAPAEKVQGRQSEARSDSCCSTTQYDVAWLRDSRPVSSSGGGGSSGQQKLAAVAVSISTAAATATNPQPIYLPLGVTDVQVRCYCLDLCAFLFCISHVPIGKTEANRESITVFSAQR